MVVDSCRSTHFAAADASQDVSDRVARLDRATEPEILIDDEVELTIVDVEPFEVRPDGDDEIRESFGEVRIATDAETASTDVGPIDARLIGRADVDRPGEVVPEREGIERVLVACARVTVGEIVNGE
jgi:hypothetical protein